MEIARIQRRFIGNFILLNAAFKVHIFGHLIPFDPEAAAVGAEYGIGGVLKVALGVVAEFRNDLLGIVADIVTADRQTQPSSAARIGSHLGGVIIHRCDGRSAADGRELAVKLRRGKRAEAQLYIAYRPAYLLGGHFKIKAVVRLKQHALYIHQPLPHRSVGSLAEVAALGMLDMRPARGEDYLHIRYRRAGEHSQMLLLGEMHQYQALPIAVKRILTASGRELKPAAPRERRKQQMHLGIVAQRLIMPHALNAVGYRLFVKHPAVVYLHGDIKAVGNKAL